MDAPTTARLIAGVAIPASGLFAFLRLRSLTDAWTWAPFSSGLANATLRHQGAGLLLAAVSTSVVLLVSPDSRRLLSWGDGTLPARAGLEVLGVREGTPWAKVALECLPAITLSTGAFMLTNYRKLLSVPRVLSALPLALAFSASNALVEELLARFTTIGLLQPIAHRLPQHAAPVISGVLFGLPHYWGQPSGLVGVGMASFLGWFLARACAETHGLGIPWMVHAAQDVVIFTTLLAAEAQQSPSR